MALLLKKKLHILIKKKKIKNKENWKLIRNFKATKLKDSTGIEKEIGHIRELLNKITKATYDENLQKIEEKITEFQAENMEIISKYIFEIASTNKFFSELYAKLYHDLIGKNDLCLKSLKNFLFLFKQIEYVDPEKDYEAFCIINEQNEKRRAMSQFFINLVKNKMINSQLIEELIISLLEKLMKDLQGDQQELVNEIVENLFILLYKNKDLFKTDVITEHINTIISLKKKDYPSITKKIIFKFMDIRDS